MVNTEFAIGKLRNSATVVANNSTNSKPLGHIVIQARLGFPAGLILPLSPINAKGLDPDFASPGKTPATPIGSDGKWRPMPNWRDGADDLVLRSADAKGANCGLLLGTVEDGRQFVMLDGDLATDTPAQVKVAEALRTVALDEISKHLDAPLWIRYTRPGRFAVLLGIAANEKAGGKREYHLSAKQATMSLGKVELLATGQQTAIGGLHPFTRL
jgi:hypothetical protein